MILGLPVSGKRPIAAKVSSRSWVRAIQYPSKWTWRSDEVKTIYGEPIFSLPQNDEEMVIQMGPYQGPKRG